MADLLFLVVLAICGALLEPISNQKLVESMYSHRCRGTRYRLKPQRYGPRPGSRPELLQIRSRKRETIKSNAISLLIVILTQGSNIQNWGFKYCQPIYVSLENLKLSYMLKDSTPTTSKETLQAHLEAALPTAALPVYTVKK
jgi:hypothetical protein